jgi:hypothetical protein
VSDGGHSGGNGDVRANDDINSEYSDAGDTIIKNKAIHNKGVNIKMFHSEPQSISYIVAKKPKAPTFQQTASLHGSVLCFLYLDNGEENYS